MLREKIPEMEFSKYDSVDEINEPLEVTSKVRYNQVDTEAVATM